jgi:integrase
MRLIWCRSGLWARVVPFTKNRSVRVKEIWSEDLIAWLDWRVAQSTPERQLRGEVALFPNPTARNVSKRWGITAAEREWERACDAVGIRVSLQEGTRHCILTKLGTEMPQMVLQAFSGHRDAKSLEHYSKPKATKATLRRITGGGDD